MSSERNLNKSRITRLFEASNNSKVYGKGEFIYQEGSQVNGIYRVKKGRVKLWKMGTSFTRSLIFYFLHEYDFFGITDFFYQEKKRRCSASAMDKEVVVQFIHFSEVERYIFKDAEFRKDITTFLVKSEETIFEKCVELQSNNIDERIFRTLQNLAKRNGSLTKDGMILKTIIHQDLSDYIGVSRQSVTHAFLKLKKMDLIDYDRKYILIKNKKHKK